MKPLFRNQKHIKNQSDAIASEQLAFLDGRALGEIDFFAQSGETRRKVRRIVEKRVCQEMHRKGKAVIDNWNRFHGKRRTSNQMKNIFGDIPVMFAA